jgi:hypothetical protein
MPQLISIVKVDKSVTALEGHGLNHVICGQENGISTIIKLENFKKTDQITLGKVSMNRSHIYTIVKT